MSFLISKGLTVLKIGFILGSILTGSITILYYKNKIQAEVIREQEGTSKIQEKVIEIEEEIKNFQADKPSLRNKKLENAKGLIKKLNYEIGNFNK